LISASVVFLFRIFVPVSAASNPSDSSPEKVQSDPESIESQRANVTGADDATTTTTTTTTITTKQKKNERGVSNDSGANFRFETAEVESGNEAHRSGSIRHANFLVLHAPNLTVRIRFLLAGLRFTLSSKLSYCQPSFNGRGRHSQ